MRIANNWRRLQMRVRRVTGINLTEAQARSAALAVSNGRRLSFAVKVELAAQRWWSY